MTRYVALLAAIMCLVLPIPSAVGETSTSMATPPGAPTNLKLTKDVAAGTATIAWSAPASNGGSPITGYLVARDGTDSAGAGAYSKTVSGTARSFTFTRLVPYSTYTLSVQAVNAAGTGPSASGTVVMATKPGVPTGVRVTKDYANRSATIHWSPPEPNAITSYIVARDGIDSQGKGPYSKTVDRWQREFTFSLLKAGVTYTLSVAATNVAGTGPKAFATVTMTAPGPNRIRNGSFELDADADGAPDYWTQHRNFKRGWTPESSPVYGDYLGYHAPSTTDNDYTISQVIPNMIAGPIYNIESATHIGRTDDRFRYSLLLRWRRSDGTTIRTDTVFSYTSGWGYVDQDGWPVLYLDRAAIVAPSGTSSVAVLMKAESLRVEVLQDDLVLNLP